MRASADLSPMARNGGPRAVPYRDCDIRHGCVNLPLDIAAWLYAWAPVGTLMQIVA